MGLRATLCVCLLASVHNIGMMLVEASECLVGCELMNMYAFDDDGLVEWDERSACDSSAGCEVVTPDSEVSWKGCGYTAGDQCLWATVSGTDGSSDCECSVCGAYRQGSSVYYMDEYPMWTRIACFLADMEAIGYDITVCVAAVVDDGAMACVDEAYQPPTLGQFDCTATELEDNSAEVECYQSGSAREAAEMFTVIGTSSSSTSASVVAPTPHPTPGPVVASTSDASPSTSVAPTPDPTPAPAKDPTPGPVVAPASEDASPTTAVAPTPDPTPAPAKASEASTTESTTDSDEKSHTTEIIIGVVSTVIGGIILAVIKKHFFS